MGIELLEMWAFSVAEGLGWLCGAAIGLRGFAPDLLRVSWRQWLRATFAVPLQFAAGAALGALLVWLLAAWWPEALAAGVPA